LNDNTSVGGIWNPLAGSDGSCVSSTCKDPACLHCHPSDPKICLIYAYGRAPIVADLRLAPMECASISSVCANDVIASAALCYPNKLLGPDGEICHTCGTANQIRDPLGNCTTATWCTDIMLGTVSVINGEQLCGN
jgi:hypothetical protein